MRRLLFALPLLFAVPARAQSMKIGYVDVQRAVQEVEEGKTAREHLQHELEAKRADLNKTRSVLEKWMAAYDKQAPVLSDDAERKRQEDLQKADFQTQSAVGEMQ